MVVNYCYTKSYEMSNFMKKLLVVDGNSIINRAFYGVRPLTNSAGLHTNALSGMFDMLYKQLSAVKPDYAAIAFDLSAPTFRHKEYAEYKAGRKKMPDELAVQLPYSKRLAKALGLHVLEKEGYEADDILGTVSKMAEDEGVESYILTGDRDSLQLIGDSTSVLLMTNSDTVRYDRAKFFETYGLRPESFVDVKALMGDSSDNIPGVPGIGEKTALKLISSCENIDRVYDDPDSLGLGKSALQKLKDGKELAYKSKFLATIIRDVPLGLTLTDLESSGIDKGATYNLLSELEFASKIKRLGLTPEMAKDTPKEEAPVKSATKPPAPSTEKNAPATPDITLPELKGEWSECLALAEKIKDFGDIPDSIPVKDLAPSELSAFSGKLVSMVYRDSELWLCDGQAVNHFVFDDLSSLARAVSEANIAPLLHDCKKAFKDFMTVGCDIKSAGDIMLCAYSQNPARSSFELFDLGEVIDRTPSGESVAIFRIFKKFYEELDAGALQIAQKIELPLAYVLADMELCGFALDVSALADFGKKLRDTENDCISRIHMLCGREFNVNSPKQLGEVLFDELKLPAGKKTKTGYSTNAEVLEKLRDAHPIVNEVLEYREIAKLRSTYADGLLHTADENGKVHTSFNQTITVTGRLSSTEPNLQNIPVRSALGRELRRFFVASEPDRVLIDADYSQIELRILAHVARDEEMIKAFLSGEDIHTFTASQVFGVPLERVTPELRKRAKAVNFGIVYGISEFSLAGDLGITRKEAAAYIQNYFERYKGISNYLSDAVSTAKALGYAQTVFGRTRQIPELTSQKFPIRQFGERVAMNSPIQGSAADIIKLAMIRVHSALKAEKLDARLILQVHDELIIESHKDCAERASEILRREMENVVSLRVPLTVDLNIGKSWYECK